MKCVKYSNGQIVEQIMNDCRQLLALFALCVMLTFNATLLAADIDELQRDFDQPPDDARIMMRWWWFGPAVDKPELEREMKIMKEGGIGGVEVQATYPLSLDDEKTGIKNYKFLSQEHLEALAFTAEKAKELGLRMDLTLGSGWPYGGPQFSVSEAAGSLLSESGRIRSGYNYVPLPNIYEGERVIAAFIGPMKQIKPGDIPDEESQTRANAPRSSDQSDSESGGLDGRDSAAGGSDSRITVYKELEIQDNKALLPKDLGSIKRVTFIIASQTMMKVKRAAYGAEGFVIDHYNPAVIDKFIKQMAEPALQACGVNKPYAVFCDSLESAGEDWTGNFFEEFKKRRGYDLKPHFAAIFFNTSAKARDIRHDWGQTLTELFNDYFISAFEKWSKANGTKFRIQAYGTPPAALYSYAYADLCEGEGYTWKGFRETRWAASANHLLGRPITSSETWTWLHSPVFRASPLDIKAEANLHFLQGVNQLIGHGWPYTPPGVEYPGWRFYASTVFSEKNPWWIVMPDLAKYLQRVSYMMRQGQPANDVALYLSNSDAWASFVPGKVAMNSAISRRLGRGIIREILESGYNLDFFDDGLLEMRGKVDDGALAFGDVKYKVVVLPGVERIPPSTLRKLEGFVKGGGILIATRSIPSIAPGFKATEEDQKTVMEIAQGLFKGQNAPAIFLESDADLGKVLADRLPPDVRFEPAAPEIGFVHRKMESGDVYFLANTDNKSKNVKATFRVKATQPEQWDPMTGRVEAVKIVGQNNDGVSINLDLAPYSSQIIVFTKRALPAAEPATHAVPLQRTIDLSSGWNVYFGNDKKPVVMDKLSSWTENEATRYFSGVAVYEKKVTVPAEMFEKGVSVQIVFGQSKPKVQGDSEDSQSPTDIAEAPRAQDDTADAMRAPARPGPRMQAFLDAPVREAAVVYVNGKRAGTIWCPPYRVDLTGLLRAGENEIRIEVANLAVNYMADFKNHPLPDYKPLIKMFGDRFQPQDMKKIEHVTSGLLGPVVIIAEKKHK
jgi:hypothetical protein